MVKNRYYSFLRKNNTLATYQTRVSDIEKELPIEDCDENALEALAAEESEKKEFEDGTKINSEHSDSCDDDEEFTSPRSIPIDQAAAQ